ncbi:hypothetical protein HMI54_013935 [Coelomomyces lativittatus]|nr:hypothetical protein HMI54_013935 [Coelomomyces lativittatus]
MTLLPLLPSTPHSEHPTTATPSSSSCSPTSLKVDPSTFTFSSTKNGEKQLPDGTKVIQEGQALIHQDPHVFYNPVQEFNRDLSIAVIQAWRVLRTEHQRTLYQTKNKPLSPTYEFTPTVLEALAATGLRSIRYAKEIPYLKKVVCNDLDPNAVESIHKNLILNQVSEELIMPHCGDAK